MARGILTAAPAAASGAVAPQPSPQPPKPDRVAALPPATTALTPGRLDGTYTAKFTMISQNGFLPVDASIAIFAGQITGTGAGSGSASYDSCVLSGSVNPDTGEIKTLTMSCRWINASFKGRFAVNAESGVVEGITEPRAITDGRVVPVLWRR